jgi:hypothetical protein
MALVQFRGTNSGGLRNLSWYEFVKRAKARIGVQIAAVIIFGAGATCKKRDKFFNSTVRVSVSCC